MDQAYQQAIADAVKEAEKDVFISAEKTFAWLEQLGADPTTPVPIPDIFRRNTDKT